MQSQSFGAPAINQTPAASGSAGGGGTTPAAQPKQQRVRARRGQATDPHSIAERVRLITVFPSFDQFSFFIFFLIFRIFWVSVLLFCCK